MIDLEAAGAEAEILKVGRALLEQLEGGRQPLTVRAERMVNMAHAPMVASFAYHAMRLGSTVLDLYDRGLRLEAMPLVRATYETAITAMWLSQSREATYAFHNEHERQHRVMIAKAMKSASDALREGAQNLNRQPIADFETSANPQGRWFEQRCGALQAGDQAYMVYRVMSTYVHPSVAITEYYLRETDNEAGVTLYTEPDQPKETFSLYMTVASMVWALRAVDHMDSGHALRSYLRQVARHLGVAETLPLTEEARAAEVRADRDRRRAHWKGPRSKRFRDADPSFPGSESVSAE